MDALERRRIPPPARGKRLAGLTACVVLAAPLFWLSSQAQVSVSGRAKNFVAPVTDAQGRRSVVRGKDAQPSGPGKVEITGMQAETYRGQQKDLTVEAPRCVFDTKSNVAVSPDSLTIRTADERFSLEGEGFRWQLGNSSLNSKLVISNRVHSLVRKRLIALQTGSGPGGLTASKPSAPAGTDEFIDIRSEQFVYESDRAVYLGNVRVQDPEGDLACEALTVFFQGESAALERIEAERNVALSQGDTRATADKAIYTVGQNQDVVEFAGHATWEAGGRQGSGDRLTFDRRTRTLRADGTAFLKLPRTVLTQSGFLLSGPAPGGSRTPGTADFIEVFADLMTVQLPPTNGPVRQITAEKHVLIMDPGQDGRALADRAVYEESTGVLELTGAPILETQRRLVNGQVLRFDPVTKVFSAGPDAYVKLPFQSVAQLGLLPTAPGSASTARAATNQFIEVWAGTFEYRTNQLQFRGAVRANFLEGAVALGKLTCQTVTVGYAEQVESLVADGQVFLEQFAGPEVPDSVVRTVHCERLRAQFDPQGRLEMAAAEVQVQAAQEEPARDRARPVITTLSSDKVTAYFSTLTNRLERLVAEKDVVFTQEERSARGAKAVYTNATGLLELTGEPTARMPEGQILEAERLMWDRAHERFIGQGRFKSQWKRAPGNTNRVAAPWLGAQERR